jgi:uncharacterized protein (TIGR02300 family)
MVDKERFGERHTCFACGCKFYDMHRNPPTCPKCGTDASRPPKQAEEATFAPEVEEPEEEEIVDEIDEKAIDVDTEEEAGRGEDEGEAND